MEKAAILRIRASVAEWETLSSYPEVTQLTVNKTSSSRRQDYVNGSHEIITSKR